MVRLHDKDNKIMEFRTINIGAVITKGKRTLTLIFKSVDQSKLAKKTLSENSFDKLFKKGRKLKLLGPNQSFIKFK